jgi:hypothetical protein
LASLDRAARDLAWREKYLYIFFFVKILLIFVHSIRKLILMKIFIIAER